MLMAGNDNETPAEYCDSVLPPLKAKGAPVEWHLYPGVTHCWDCSSLNGFTKTLPTGTHVAYKYDKATTEDSRKRVFDFLSRQLKKP
jgi:dienelactone hydrolase